MEAEVFNFSVLFVAVFSISLLTFFGRFMSFFQGMKFRALSTRLEKMLTPQALAFTLTTKYSVFFLFCVCVSTT